jgi:hypothetical protein
MKSKKKDQSALESLVPIGEPELVRKASRRGWNIPDIHRESFK